MSESGKVSLPTPERIEELKGRFKDVEPEELTFIKVGELNELLAALEESQQEYEIMKYDRDALVKLVSNHQSAVDDACRELAEAQQTIARQQEALEFIADMKIIGSAHVSMQAIARGVLKGNFLEGNKKGSDKA
ncbi:hypothetical protein NST48_12540 [Paenibacillus sp. FSL M7-0547]|uniref:hypothetical protein n=1 Tax=Paenibacillus sp. FSL M7-0547 TaxID=2954755 RepID=UPI0030F73FB4